MNFEKHYVHAHTNHSYLLPITHAARQPVRAGSSRPNRKEGTAVGRRPGCCHPVSGAPPHSQELTLRWSLTTEEFTASAWARRPTLTRCHRSLCPPGGSPDLRGKNATMSSKPPQRRERYNVVLKNCRGFHCEVRLYTKETAAEQRCDAEGLHSRNKERKRARIS